MQQKGEVPKDIIIGQMKRKWRILNRQASKEEDKLLLAHWKQREEVKRAGEDYIPWATHMWKQGKALQLRGPDIIALEDPDTKEIKLEQGMQKVMEEYMHWLWGSRENKTRYKTTRKLPKEEISDKVNQKISQREVGRAIR